jgi:AcrR family transcriptional regulator
VGWNTDLTRRRLQEAATAEFAARGLAGTTVERIAARAGINKERLYNYFGSKDQLFATVLSSELAKVAAAVPVELLSEVEIGEFAGRVFDYHADNPQLARLMQWESLAYGADRVPDEVARTEFYKHKVTGFRQAQRDGVLRDEPDAAHLYFLVLGLAAWWFVVPQIARMLTGVDGQRASERALRRAAVVEATRRISAAGPPGSPDSTSRHWGTR